MFLEVFFGLSSSAVYVHFYFKAVCRHKYLTYPNADCFDNVVREGSRCFGEPNTASMAVESQTAPGPSLFGRLFGKGISATQAESLSGREPGHEHPAQKGPKLSFLRRCRSETEQSLSPKIDSINSRKDSLKSKKSLSWPALNVREDAKTPSAISQTHRRHGEKEGRISHRVTGKVNQGPHGSRTFYAPPNETSRNCTSKSQLYTPSRLCEVPVQYYRDLQRGLPPGLYMRPPKPPSWHGSSLENDSESTRATSPTESTSGQTHKHNDIDLHGTKGKLTHGQGSRSRLEQSAGKPRLELGARPKTSADPVRKFPPQHRLVHRARIRRTRSEFLNETELPDGEFTVSLSELEPSDFRPQITAHAQQDVRVYWDENKRRCRQWLAEVSAQASVLEDVQEVDVEEDGDENWSLPPISSSSSTSS
ncbi:Hypp1997 [Branchiostoma lanceolatum]|uniref:Hypp1997 protein n=1 Tax=Branchiostoma lanceolatum TaxID=7740 RepID=A0A8K0EQY3_BRALA|nr:Hypp1997 [Branchiostoma lanceolatum]